MGSPQIHPRYYLCHACSNAMPVPEDFNGSLLCERCGSKTHRLKPKSLQMTLAFTLTALILYIPANLFPFMTIELYGSRNSTTIWGGIQDLADSGSWAIAIIVFVASILVPFLKLIILFYLSIAAHWKKHSRFNTRLYQAIEAIGRWSMLDIFLLAVLVAIMKLGPWTTVQPEIGSVLFAFVVIFTMLASASFDSRLLWKEGSDENEKS